MSPERHTSDTGEARRRQVTGLAGVTLGRQYGLRDARIRLLRDKGPRHIFRVEHPTGGKFVLRMYDPPHAGLPNTRRSQVLWLQDLRRETQLLLPEPMLTVDGSPLGYVPASEPNHSDRYCVLLRWVPGRPKTEDLSPADLSLVGSFVARMHHHAEQYSVPRESTFRRWDWHWPFGKSAPLWSKGEAFYSPGEMEVYEAAARRVRLDLERLGEGDDVFGLIHRDLNLENLVFHDGAVGAIDFDLSGWGYYLFDLYKVRMGLKKHRGDDDAPLLSTLLEGYERDRPLPEEPQKYFETFTMMLRVSAVNRQLAALHREATPLREGPHLLSNTVKWLERLL